MRKLTTKKAINLLVKQKETQTIINLYEKEKELNPVDSYTIAKNIEFLNPNQKEAAKEMLSKGHSFGLPKELTFNLKEQLGLGKFVSQVSDNTHKTYYIDHGSDKMIFVSQYSTDYSGGRHGTN